MSAVAGAAVGIGIICCCVVAGRTDKELGISAFEEVCFGDGEVPDFEEFKEATKPAVEWLNRNGNPHQRIIIELGGVELVSGEMAYPTEIPD